MQLSKLSNGQTVESINLKHQFFLQDFISPSWFLYFYVKKKRERETECLDRVYNKKNSLLSSRLYLTRFFIEDKKPQTLFQLYFSERKLLTLKLLFKQYGPQIAEQVLLKNKSAVSTEFITLDIQQRLECLASAQNTSQSHSPFQTSPRKGN